MDMPIVEIEITLRQNETLRENLASDLADEFGKIFDSPRATTWVKLYLLPASHYAENDGTQIDIYPIFIRVLKSELPGQIKLHGEVDMITSAVSNICGRPPENVHIIFETNGRGRVAFGGKLIT
jgi:phenylpyruvate tautomerase PptA (4-oxalocrotonate tautomerase family)